MSTSGEGTLESTHQSIILQLDDAYRQLAQNLIGESIPTIALPKYSTRGAVSKVIAQNLADDETSVWFRRKSSSLAMERDRPQTQENVAPIRANRTEHLPPLSRPSPAILRDLRQMARETNYPGAEPFADLHVGMLHGLLPTIRGSMLLIGIDSVEEDPVAKIEDIEMLWDTGSPITYVSDDLVSPAFKVLLAAEKNMVANRWGARGTKSIADGWLRFSNCQAEFNGLVVVCPRSEMPNNHSGVVLGQRTLLERMMFTIKPKAILKAQGQDIAEGHWGDICLKTYLTLSADREVLLHY